MKSLRIVCSFIEAGDGHLERSFLCVIRFSKSIDAKNNFTSLTNSIDQFKFKIEKIRTLCLYSSSIEVVIIPSTSMSCSSHDVYSFLFLP